MAYTSDLRVKNILKEVHLEAQKEIKKIHSGSNLRLRIFDESKEDSYLWEDGGLTFKDNLLDLKLGSNDGGWYIIKEGIEKPLVIVEGTFGTERGQFGDGQNNRFSHPLGPAKNGIIGVLLTPFKGESFVKNELIEDGFNYKFQYAYLRKDIVRAALNVNKRESGKYFAIDTYNTNILKELIVESYKKEFNIENNFENICNSVEEHMKDYLVGTRKGKSNQELDKIFDSNKNDISDQYTGRLYTHNIAALTTSAKRDGHGLLGKNLIQTYLVDTDKIISIFLRLNQDELTLLENRNAKEFTYLLKNPIFKVVSIDNLIFENQSTRDKLIELREENLHSNSQKDFIKLIKKEFEEGKILIKLS